MPSRLSIFCIGTVLGGVTAFVAIRPPAPATPPVAAAAETITLPAWDWRKTTTPPPLSRASATAAVSAWLAHRGPDGEKPSFAVRATSLRALLLHLPPDALPALLNGLSRSTDPDDQRLRTVAFTAWTAQDAPGATRWAVAQGASAIDLARTALAAWTELDPVAATTWVCAIPDEELARKLAGKAFAVLAHTDPARALSLARSRGDTFRHAALTAIIAALGQKDPSGTVRTFAPELWNDGQGFYTLQGALGAWLKQDAPAALAWLVTQPRQSDRHLAHWIASLGGWQPESRRTVADAILSAPGIPNRAAVLQDMLFHWSTERPEEAIAWLNSISDPDLRLNVIARASNAYMTNNPEKSLPLALAMPEGGSRTSRISMLLGEWAKINPTAALAWINEHDMPGVETAVHAAHGALLAEIAREDPRLALKEWAALSDPKTRLATIDSLATAWGQKDPAAALQWAAKQHEATQTRGSPAYDVLLGQWSRTQPEAALRWLEDWSARQPNSLNWLHYFDALASDVNGKTHRGPTADLYSKIENPKLRSTVLTRHVREWLTKDPAGARTWLETHDALSPAEATSLLAAAK